MTWKEFTETIHKVVKGKKENPAKTLIEIFERAKSVNGITPSTAKSWITGKRKCNANRYFDDGKLKDEKGVFNYFYNRPDIIKKELQKAFRELNDNDSPVDTQTNDMEYFCWTVVNQFLDLLGFERIDIPNSSKESKNATTNLQSEDIKQSENQKSISMQIDTYLKKARDKYGKKKPFLFPDKTLPFYDLYVFNELTYVNDTYNENAEKDNGYMEKLGEFYSRMYEIRQKAREAQEKVREEADKKIRDATDDKKDVIEKETNDIVDEIKKKMYDELNEIHHYIDELEKPHNRRLSKNKVTSDFFVIYNRRAIITGEHGLGKSMMMQHLLLDSIKKYDELKTVPILMDFKEYDYNFNSFEEMIYEAFTSLNNEMEYDSFISFIKNKRLLLMLDHIDMIKPEFVGQFNMQMDKCVNNYSDISVVISTNSADNYLYLEQFREFHIEPLNYPQAFKLMENLLGKKQKDEEIKDVAKWCESEYDPKGSIILSNPLMVKLAVKIYQEYGKIPDTECDFFYQLFELMYKAANYRGNKTKSFDEIIEFRSFLMKFCKETCLDCKFAISDDDFLVCFRETNIAIYGEQKINFSDFIDDLVNKMGIMYIEKDGKGHTQYRFIHDSFQEYFCASYFARDIESFSNEIAGLFYGKNWLQHVFEMLYDMKPGEIEQYVFLPALAEVYENKSDTESFLMFMKKAHPFYGYIDDPLYELVENNYSHFSIVTFLISFFKLDDFSKEDNEDSGNHKSYKVPLIEKSIIDDSHPEYKIYRINIDTLISEQKKYADFIAALSNDSMPFMKEYKKLQEYYNELKKDMTS